LVPSGEDAALDTGSARLLLLGEIAGEIAHELRNALQVVSTHAYLAKQDPASSASHIAKIEKNARIAQGIVDDVLSLARGEPIRRQSCNLRELIEAARAQLLVAPPMIELPNEDVVVHAHATLLVRVFKVLLENAAQVGASEVTITWRRGRQDGVEIELVDDGPGVKAEIAERLFDPLFTGRAGGTGLGLALARRVANAHGGSLELVVAATPGSGPASDPGRTGLGRGARFRLTLPA
jgi:signal transduction histidine kinase